MGLVPHQPVAYGSWYLLKTRGKILNPLRLEHPFYKQIPKQPVHPVGTLIIQDNKPELEDECLAWLDKQPLNSVLFVALGSGGTLSAAQLTDSALGLELSQKRFILVARKPTDACASASATFFNVGENVNDSKAYLPDGFLLFREDQGGGFGGSDLGSTWFPCFNTHQLVRFCLTVCGTRCWRA